MWWCSVASDHEALERVGISIEKFMEVPSKPFERPHSILFLMKYSMRIQGLYSSAIKP